MEPWLVILLELEKDVETSKPQIICERSSPSITVPSAPLHDDG